MATLEEGRISIALRTGKPTGLGDLGIPPGEETRIMKGQGHEFVQTLAGGGVGRMFQNIRVIAVWAPLGDAPVVKLFVILEVFGDNTLSQGPECGLTLRLYAGAQHLMDLPTTSLFLPYPNCWYDNRFAFDLPVDVFEALDHVALIVGADTVVVL
ncbi:hypothetical protein A9404_01910 [Halothiobacillus diazotrophicus]|uniref:Uncharacterized protein n=1 Tax=Halothiobacillus diazotrophicus TaxID=1860122 RepID=A0A191ZEK1_9GAMM|nr:hypothetical protein [Halothiobacillus diazotrophicus]ANJ66298.1 hypothetical protein A9404_01910 [Halothiobacillus diazotrophicus]